MKYLIPNLICAVIAVVSTSMIKTVVTNRLIWKGNILKLINDLLIIAKIPEVWIAFFLFTLSQIVWIYILATQKLAIAYPIQLALTISLLSIIAHFFFKETISIKQIMALCLIFFGIILLKI